MPALAGLIALMLLSLAGCHGPSGEPARPSLPTGSSDHSLQVDGRTRGYHAYVPAAVANPAPLVVMLHGGFGTGSQAEDSYGWDALADREGVIVVYPDGLDRAWNAGGGCCGQPGQSNVDDVAFVRAVVAEVMRARPVDPARVFATGISNGGMMAYRLACDSDLFAAIGPDSATLLGRCAPPTRVSVIHIHGTADENIPYLGGRGSGFAHIDGPPVPDVVAQWRATDGCGTPTVTTLGIVTTSAASCPDGRAVELVTIDGAGHQWPGSPSRPVLQHVLGLDPPSPALDATQVIWDFSRPTRASLRDSPRHCGADACPEWWPNRGKVHLSRLGRSRRGRHRIHRLPEPAARLVDSIPEMPAINSY